MSFKPLNLGTKTGILDILQIYMMISKFLLTKYNVMSR